MSEIDTSDQSPCVRDCCLGDDLTCLGCFRTLDEIKEWGLADSPRRRVILQNARQRREDHQVSAAGTAG
ncbi:MAG TPA: DUF1289 domain-containing protein [Steroidobacteraceae bacterium]|nr:DUF1289 domain-containing protein [Steroidobacteraceae bacterium]